MTKPFIKPLKFVGGIADDHARLYLIRPSRGSNDVVIAVVEFQDTGEELTEPFDNQADAYAWLHAMNGYYAGYNDGYREGYTAERNNATANSDF